MNFVRLSLKGCEGDKCLQLDLCPQSADSTLHALGGTLRSIQQARGL